MRALPLIRPSFVFLTGNRGGPLLCDSVTTLHLAGLFAQLVGLLLSLILCLPDRAGAAQSGRNSQLGKHHQLEEQINNKEDSKK